MSNVGAHMIIIIKVKKWNKKIGKFKFCVWKGENGMREFVTCHL